MGQTTEQVIRLDLPSVLNSVYVLEAIISELLRAMELDEETSDDVNLAVIEAGTNAIKHGNHEDPLKRAVFDFILQWDKFTIVIEDQGEGFEREQIPDPTHPENFYKSNGRGLFLMEDCMDNVTYEKSGTLVRMVKKLRR